MTNILEAPKIILDPTDAAVLNKFNAKRPESEQLVPTSLIATPQGGRVFFARAAAEHTQEGHGFRLNAEVTLPLTPDSLHDAMRRLSGGYSPFGACL